MKKNFGKKAFSMLEVSIAILIIGIIIGGILQSNKLFRKMRLNTARALTESSAPHSIEDIYFWLDATADGATDLALLEDGAKVSLWKDFNSHKNNGKINFFQEDSDDYKPLFRKNSINGLPAISFDGIDDNLINGGAATDDLISAENGFTIFFAANIHAGLVFFSFDNYDGGSTDYRLNITFSANVIPDKQVRFDYPNGVEKRLVGSINVENKPMILTVSSDATTKKIRINGALDAQQSNDVRMGDMSQNIILGAYSPTEWFGACQIDIGEIIMFNRALNDNEVRDIEKYLGKKWGIGLAS